MAPLVEEIKFIHGEGERERATGDDKIFKKIMNFFEKKKFDINYQIEKTD